MGWRSVKEYYNIEHIVQVRDGIICIGSAYIHDLITISMEGELVKSYRDRSNDDLARYQKEIDSDLETLRRMVVTPDKFEKSITVWTYDGGEILEKQCEDPTWPNVTHDGEMIYENTFSTDRDEVVKWAKKNARCHLDRCVESLTDAEDRMRDRKRLLEEAKQDLEKLEAL